MQNTTEQNGTPQSGLVLREGFGSRESMQLAELSAKAAAEQARASVEARYIMAIQRPRDTDVFRNKLLKECRRPSFAAVGLYSKPIGGSSITGFSIRFAEAALRLFTNIYASTETIYDDNTKRIVRITVTDLEGNVTYPKDITLQKLVERRNGKGRVVVGKRTNTGGDVVYIVEATEDELATKEAAAASKALRQVGLRLIPGDVLDEARAQLEKTLNDENAKDPDSARKKVVDSFAFYNIGPEQLAEYLGKPLAQATPDELRQLVTTYNTIRESETTWQEVLEAKQLERAPKNAPAPTQEASSSEPQSATQRLANKVRAQKEQPAPAQSATKEAVGNTEAGTSPTPPEAQSKESPPAPTSEPPAAAELTPGQIKDFKAKLTAIQGELITLVDRERAQAAWKKRVSPLAGVKTQADAEKRLSEAKDLVELAKLEADINEAKKRVLAHVADGDKAIRLNAKAKAATKDVLTLDLVEASEAVEALLGMLDDARPADEVADLPWGNKDGEREPGADG